VIAVEHSRYARHEASSAVAEKPARGAEAADLDRFSLKTGSLPQIGRDVVKIRWTHGVVTSSCGGHPRSLNAK
jgi:hypothetical protein